MGSLISTVCLDVINVLLVDYLFSSLYKVKKNKKVYLVIIALVYVFLHLKFLYGYNTICLDFLMILCVSMSLKAEIPIVRRMIVSVFMIIVSMLCEILVYQVLTMIFNINSTVVGVRNNDLLKFFRTIISRYLVYIGVQVVLYKKDSLKEVHIKIFKYISLGVSIFYGICILTCHKEILFYHDEAGRIFVFTLILYNAVLVIFNFYQNMHVKTVRELEVIKQNRSYQTQYWKSYYENNEEVRRFKHDMLNGYTGLLGLLDVGKFDEAKKSLENSIGNLKQLERVDYFSNPMIDAILSKKVSDAKMKGIEFVFRGGIINLGIINDEDLGVLLANALDNAIEATEKAEYKRIELSVSTSSGLLSINVVNYVDDIDKVSFNKTSKVFDKGNHGLGIKSMKACVKKYNGYLNYEKRDNKVILSIVMCIS